MCDFFEARSAHYREMALGIRCLARQTRFPSIRRELVDIANRYDRMADYVSFGRPGNAVDEPHRGSTRPSSPPPQAVVIDAAHSNLRRRSAGRVRKVLRQSATPEPRQ